MKNQKSNLIEKIKSKIKQKNINSSKKTKWWKQKTVSKKLVGSKHMISFSCSPEYQRRKKRGQPTADKDNDVNFQEWWPGTIKKIQMQVYKFRCAYHWWLF